MCTRTKPPATAKSSAYVHAVGQTNSGRAHAIFRRVRPYAKKGSASLDLYGHLCWDMSSMRDYRHRVVISGSELTQCSACIFCSSGAFGADPSEEILYKRQKARFLAILEKIQLYAAIPRHTGAAGKGRSFSPKNVVSHLPCIDTSSRLVKTLTGVVVGTPIAHHRGDNLARPVTTQVVSMRQWRAQSCHNRQ